MNGSVGAQYHHRFDSSFAGFKPNPHIDEFECMGNYKRTINEALARRDYITALEQCVASAKSLNLHDSAVIGRFISQFTHNGGTSYKAIELPDGRVVSPNEAIKWIEDQENAANAATAPDGVIPEAGSAERMAEVPADAADRIAAVEATGTIEDDAPIPF